MVCMCVPVRVQETGNDSILYLLADVVARGMAYFGQGNGSIYLSCLFYTGTEEKLINCSSTDERTCDHSEDAGVQCGGESLSLSLAVNTTLY